MEGAYEKVRGKKRKEKGAKQPWDSLPEELEEWCLLGIREKRQVNKFRQQADQLFSVSSEQKWA